MTQRQFLRGVKLVWIEGFLSSILASPIKALELSLFIRSRRRDWFRPFARAFARSEMHRVTFWIWTRVADSTFYGDNRYIKSTSSKYFPNTSAMDKMRHKINLFLLKPDTAGLNSAFSFSLLGCPSKTKKFKLVYERKEEMNSCFSHRKREEKDTQPCPGLELRSSILFQSFPFSRLVAKPWLKYSIGVYACVSTLECVKQFQVLLSVCKIK